MSKREQAALDEVFGAVVRPGRPRLRVENTKVVSFHAPNSITRLARRKIDKSHGLFVRYMTIAYVRFIRTNLDELWAEIDEFEAEHGPVEKLTAERIHRVRKTGHDKVARLRGLRKDPERRASGFPVDIPSTD